MQSTVKKFGNSSGVIIPKPMLTQIGVSAGDVLEMRIEGTSIVIQPIKAHPREGWAEAAKALTDAGDDEFVWDKYVEDEDDEWTW